MRVQVHRPLDLGDRRPRFSELEMAFTHEIVPGRRVLHGRPHHLEQSERGFEILLLEIVDGECVEDLASLGLDTLHPAQMFDRCLFLPIA